MFEYSNEANKLQKNLKLHKGAVRSVEFDRTGKFLVSGSKDKSFKITDIVSEKERPSLVFAIKMYKQDALKSRWLHLVMWVSWHYLTIWFFRDHGWWNFFSFLFRFATSRANMCLQIIQ